MENVTKSAESAIKVLQKQKEVLDSPHWEEMLRPAYPGLRRAQENLEETIPGLEREMVGPGTQWEGLAGIMIDHSRIKYNNAIRNFIRNMVSVNTHVIGKELDDRIRDYVNKAIPRMKRLEIQFFKNQLKQKLNSQYVKKQTELQSKQMDAVQKLS